MGKENHPNWGSAANAFRAKIKNKHLSSSTNQNSSWKNICCYRQLMKWDCWKLFMRWRQTLGCKIKLNQLDTRQHAFVLYYVSFWSFGGGGWNQEEFIWELCKCKGLWVRWLLVMRVFSLFKIGFTYVLFPKEQENERSSSDESQFMAKWKWKSNIADILPQHWKESVSEREKTWKKEREQSWSCQLSAWFDWKNLAAQTPSTWDPCGL